MLLQGRLSANFASMTLGIVLTGRANILVDQKHADDLSAASPARLSLMRPHALTICLGCIISLVDYEVLGPIIVFSR